MIITRTPFRVTLGGGGTDLPSYYEREGGFIFAMGIDKYMYVMVNPPIVDRKIRLHYTQSETVDHVDELQHELAREGLRWHGIEDRMEISSMADLPAGTGLGSSSAYLVGLLMALHHYRRDYVSLSALAEEACTIELETLQKRIGKQDQYMAAFGGLTVLDIGRDGGVRVRSLDLPSGAVDALVSNTHLYYTGLRRNAEDVLQEQDAELRSPSRRTEPVVDLLDRIKETGHRILEAIGEEDFDRWGRLLHRHWELKRRMSDRITVTSVDRLYQHVRKEFGVLGGKLVGAGGGGFLMLYAPKHHRRLERFMLEQGMPRLHYKAEYEGSKVIANLAGAPGMAVRDRLGVPGDGAAGPVRVGTAAS